MKKKSEFLDYVLDCLSGLEGISSRAMFGGYGIYCEGLVFAIVVDDVLYFKVADNNRKDYEEVGSKPFTYEAKGATATMSYYELPESVLTDRRELGAWVKKALAAHAAKSRKSAPKKR